MPAPLRPPPTGTNETLKSRQVVPRPNPTISGRLNSPSTGPQPSAATGAFLRRRLPYAAACSSALVAALTMSAPFSAIMMTAALVLPGWHGRHDRGVDHPQASDPAHAQLVIDHRHRIVTHLAGADHVVGGLAVFARELQPFGVGLNLVAGVHLVGAIPVHACGC